MIIAACVLALTAIQSPRAASGADPRAVDAARHQVVELRKADRILFLGDSLTHRAQGPTGFVTHVRSQLERRFPELRVQVEAVASDGDNVIDLLQRVDRDVLPRRPSIVVIQIGCNDARRLPRAKFKAGLEQLIDRLQHAGIQVVQCTLTSVGEKGDGTNKWDPQLDDYAQLAREIAVSRGVALIDLRRAFKKYWELHNPDNLEEDVLTWDGNHLNDAGNRFVGEQVVHKFRAPPHNAM